MEDFKCMECGHEFDHPETMKEHIEDNYYQEFLVCPNCGSEDYVEKHRCPICDEWCFSEDEFGICEDCEVVIREGITEILMKLDPINKQEALCQIIEVVDKLL